MKHTTIIILILLLLPAAIATNIENIAQEKIVNATKNCYVYTELPQLPPSYSTMTPIGKNPTTWHNPTLYPFWDQYAVKWLVTHRNYEVHNLTIQNKTILIFEDLGESTKNGAETILQLNSTEVTQCMLDLPKTKALVQGASSKKEDKYTCYITTHCETVKKCITINIFGHSKKLCINLPSCTWEYITKTVSGWIKYAQSEYNITASYDEAIDYLESNCQKA